MEQTHVYVPQGRVGWWGGPDTRPRCERTDKVAFESQERAEHSAAKVREREGAQKGGRIMQAYQCKDCGQWHVGHGRMKR